MRKSSQKTVTKELHKLLVKESMEYFVTHSLAKRFGEHFDNYRIIDIGKRCEISLSWLTPLTRETRVDVEGALKEFVSALDLERFNTRKRVNIQLN
jgi:hypothetical protein